ncbi:MAG: acyl-CoA synthetase [Bacteroidetes bacterium]|nr:MAG: acyl-CoA synthetase [Bacteroidota bacterium]
MTPGERLHDLFFYAAEKFPAHPALETISGEAISYAGLAEKVREISAFFKRSGIGPGTRVALLAPKSTDLVAVMLGASASGATYIPIDPAAPAERVRFLLRDLDPHALVCDPALFPSDIPCQQQNMQAQWPIEKLSITFFPGENHPGDLAYILYTSGSTGQPKGVCITHENAVSFIKWSLGIFKPGAGTRFSSIAPFHFDLSVFDLYVALASGGTILLIDDESVKNARMLTQIIAEKKINVAYATPSTWRAISDFGKPEKFDFSALHHFLFAGEVFAPKHLLALAEKFDRKKYESIAEVAAAPRWYYNLYGPTETNVCLYYAVNDHAGAEQEPAAFPLGDACLPLRIVLADEQGNFLYSSGEGEILVSGPQVFPGYWNRPEKNTEVFVEQNGLRWYRTGDRGGRISEDCIVFKGRIDRMIKKRGYRIEPGEVEAALMRHPDVLECAVTAGEDADGYALLIVYVSASKNVEITSLREHCSRTLPGYMLPDRLVMLHELPKTSSGKIDYQALRNQTNDVK